MNSEHSVNIWGKNRYAKEAKKIGSFNRSPSIDKLVFQDPVLYFWMCWCELTIKYTKDGLLNVPKYILLSLT